MYILLIILALFALILFIPVRIFVTANLSEQKITLRYAFLRYTLYPRTQKTESEKDKPQSQDKNKKK